MTMSTLRWERAGGHSSALLYSASSTARPTTLHDQSRSTLPSLDQTLAYENGCQVEEHSTSPVLHKGESGWQDGLVGVLVVLCTSDRF
mmetsp:Transcript_43680/g.76588  ORF Transcript_43680/g.76588 Transcript_43680/m.76588 type:complete len:88 (+) Transcript_43680:258-521(+)